MFQTFLLKQHSKGNWTFKGHLGTPRALGHARLSKGTQGSWALEEHLGTQALEALYLVDSVITVNNGLHNIN